MGPHCSFCGTFTGPFSEIEGLFTVLICIPCLEVRRQRDRPRRDVRGEDAESIEDNRFISPTDTRGA